MASLKRMEQWLRMLRRNALHDTVCESDVQTSNNANELRLWK